MKDRHTFVSHFMLCLLVLWLCRVAPAVALDLDDYSHTMLRAMASTLHKDALLTDQEDREDVVEILDDLELTSEERAEDSVAVANGVRDDFEDLYLDLKADLDELLDDEIDVGDTQADEDAAPGELLVAFKVHLRDESENVAVPALEALLDALERLRLGIKEPLVGERQSVEDAKTAVKQILDLMK